MTQKKPITGKDLPPWTGHKEKSPPLIKAKFMVEITVPEGAEPLTADIEQALLDSINDCTHVRATKTSITDLNEDTWLECGKDHDWLLSDGVIEQVKERICPDCDERIRRP